MSSIPPPPPLPQGGPPKSARPSIPTDPGDPRANLTPPPVPSYEPGSDGWKCDESYDCIDGFSCVDNRCRSKTSDTSIQEDIVGVKPAVDSGDINWVKVLISAVLLILVLCFIAKTLFPEGFSPKNSSQYYKHIQSAHVQPPAFRWM